MKKIPSLNILAHCLALTLVLLANGLQASESSRLSDKAPPFKTDEDLPKPTPPIIEIGDPFLGTGSLYPGFTIPTGAVWQPRFWVFGGYSTAVQTWDTGNGQQHAEWANRLDIYGNLQLTGTERIVIGLQPFEDNQGRQAGYELVPDVNGVKTFNANIRTLFFEGDLAELFPGWDVHDYSANDIGFSVGRQEMLFQGGAIINDTIDAVGFTRNNLRFESVPWLSSSRISAVYSWGNINRDGNQGTSSSNTQLFAVFSQWDTIYSTFDADLAYVFSSEESGGDLLSVGFSAIQRFGGVATTFRVLGSWAPEGVSGVADNGALLAAEVNWSPAYTSNIVYFNAFAAIEHFRSAARGSRTGGPLGFAGILFAAPAVGSAPPALSNRADNAYGIALGYQMFFDNFRRQLILEIGGRTGEDDTTGAGIAARFQQAIGTRYIIQFDTFGAIREHNQLSYGLRTEFIVKF